MPLFALMLAIIAAILHATWNFVAKKVEDKQIVTWWAILAGSGLVLPFVLPHATLPMMMWPYLLGSASAEALYYFMLILAYENADFSLTDPIARGLAPALIMLRNALLSWRTNFRAIAAIAILMPLAYGLVLQAYALAPMSDVGAIREVSIVLAAFAGWRWLGEGFGKIRTLGALCIFVGILVITIAG